MSLTSPTRDITNLWETARYDIKPRFLRFRAWRASICRWPHPRIPRCRRPLRLNAARLSLAQVTDALIRNNLVAPTGMHEEDHTLYLTVVDGRVHDIGEIGNLPLGFVDGHPLRVKDFAHVERDPEPAFNVVTANGVDAVLLNVRSQPDGSTLDIANGLKNEIRALQRELPPDIKLAFFYDQSLLVQASVRSVWEAILFGLILSSLSFICSSKIGARTLTAIVVIPVTLLITLVAARTCQRRRRSRPAGPSSTCGNPFRGCASPRRG